MNLVTQAWIPVITRQGQTRLASLLDVFSKGQDYTDLAVRPHERVALMRLLLCIAHAALDGPSLETKRNAPELLPQAAEDYLSQWHDSFDLFHKEKPFLQIAGLQAPPQKVVKAKKGGAEEAEEEGPSTKVSKLDFALATGNASTLFDHHGQISKRDVEPSRLGILLITYQMFSPGGLIGKVLWGGESTGGTSSDGPCVVASMLHAFWRGKNILQTLQLNLCSKEQLTSHYAAVGEGWWGCPVWEQMPKNLRDTQAITNTTQTYLGRLVPLSRLIRLDTNCATMLLGAGPVYPNYNSEKNPFPREPSATLVTRKEKDKEVKRILGAQPNKGFWRELHSLGMHHQAQSKGALDGFVASGNTNARDAHDLVIGAVARDQAEIVEALESVYHIPAAIYQDDGRACYEKAVQHAEKTASTLGRAVERYRSYADGGWEGRLKGAGPKKSDLLQRLREKALTRYWTAVEHNLPLLFACVESLDTEAFPDAKKAWHTACFTAALAGYRAVCEPQTPRQLKAFTLGEAIFFMKTAKTDEPAATPEGDDS